MSVATKYEIDIVEYGTLTVVHNDSPGVALDVSELDTSDGRVQLDAQEVSNLIGALMQDFSD